MGIYMILRSQLRIQIHEWLCPELTVKATVYEEELIGPTIGGK